MRLLYVARPDGRRQTIRIVVRLLDDLVDIVEAERRQHRTEDFFLSDLHVILHATENRGLNKESLAAVHADAISTRNQLRAFLLACLDVAEHGLHLLLADDCAQARFRIERIGGLHLLGASDQLFEEFVLDFAFDEQPRACVADFALAVEDSGDRALDRVVDIGIGENDVGRFAAELERDAASACRPRCA